MYPKQIMRQAVFIIIKISGLNIFRQWGTMKDPRTCFCTGCNPRYLFYFNKVKLINLLMKQVYAPTVCCGFVCTVGGCRGGHIYITYIFPITFDF